MRHKSKRAILNYKLLMRVMGWLLGIESCFMLVPFIVSLCHNDGEALAFGVTIGVTAAGALVLSFLTPRPLHDMKKRDGFLLTALVWVVFSFFGMIPFMLEPIGLDLCSAFFETMSGFTTTGVSLLPGFEPLPPSLVVWRSMMQWIGGMGIIIFTLAVLPMLNNSGGVQMFNAEVTGITHDKLRPRVSSTAKGLWGMYMSFTAICILMLWAGPMDFTQSLCTAFSVMSTGGYATQELDIATWNSTYIELVVMLFMFLGATNFTLLFGFLSGRYKALWSNDVFRFFCWAILVLFVLIVINNVLTGNVTCVKDVTLYPLFNIISVMSSTGYVVGNLTGWGPFVLSLMLIMMFFGACAGSTSGGAKLDRLLYLLKNTNNELYRGIHPNSVLGINMNGRIVPAETVNKVIAFLSLYVIVIALGTVVLTATGMPLYDSFFSSFACMSNAWVMQGATIYGGTFEILPDIAQWTLSVLMLTGRLEVYTVVLLFTPHFWTR